MKYQHDASSDTIKIKIKDSTGRIIFQVRFSANDKEKWKEVFVIARKYGFDIYSMYNDSWV